MDRSDLSFASGRNRQGQAFMTSSNGPGLEAVGSLPPVPRRGAGYWRARVASWALLGVAAALAAVFVTHIARFEATAPSSRPAADTSAPLSDQIVVTTSTLTGFDRDRQPYTITAASAVQDSTEPDRVRLNTVAGELRRNSGEVFTLAAGTALYDSKAKVLQLENEVSLVAAGRFVAEMGHAAITLSDKRLISDAPVTVTFDRGEIAAGGLEISDDGSRTVFFNRVKVIFGPQTKGDMQR